MAARLVAGACALALGMSGASAVNATHDVAEAARSVVVRVSSPVPAGMGPGHVSFAASFGGKRWSLAAFCTGREDHRRASVVFVSEPATSDE